MKRLRQPSAAWAACIAALLINGGMTGRCRADSGSIAAWVKAEDASLLHGKAAAFWLTMLYDDDPQKLAEAAEALGDICDPSDDILFALSKKAACDDARVQQTVEATLHRIDPERNGRLRMLLAKAKHESPGLRAWAILRLAEFKGPQSGPARAAVIGALQDRHWLVRYHAAMCVGDFGDGGMTAVPALIAALNDDDAHVRAAAAASLGEIGPSASASRVPLCNALGDADEHVRANAWRAIVQIGNIEAGVPILLASLHEPDEDTRFLSACLLVECKPYAVAAVTPLCDGLVHWNAAHRAGCAVWLKQMGPEARAAVPALLLALTDPSEDVRAAAADALKKIDPETADHVLNPH